MVLGDHYYLDCGRGNKYGLNAGCDPFKTWLFISQFEPTDYMNDGSILGGQVAAWSELFCPDIIHGNLWPRAAVLADKYWG